MYTTNSSGTLNHPKSVACSPTQTTMRAQYPDHVEFETYKQSGVLYNIVTYLTDSTTVSTMASFMYVLALMYTFVQCVDLLRWVIGTPVAVHTKKD